MSVFVNRIPHRGHFRFRLFCVSSMHFLQNKWGQVFSTTSRSLSPLQLHMIFPLYSYSSNLITSSSDFYFKESTRLMSCLISDLLVYFSPCSLESCFYLSAISSLRLLMMISFSLLSIWAALRFCFVFSIHYW